MRLSARLARAYPKVRIIVHNFDGVCTPLMAIAPWTKREFGVDKGSKTTSSPVRSGFKVLQTNIPGQFPANVNCIAIRSFLSGSQVVKISNKARGFGHEGFTNAQDSLSTPAGFNWYTQSFGTDEHNSIDNRHHATAVAHLREAIGTLPCDCGVPVTVPPSTTPPPS